MLNIRHGSKVILILFNYYVSRSIYWTWLPIELRFILISFGYGHTNICSIHRGAQQYLTPWHVEEQILYCLHVSFMCFISLLIMAFITTLFRIAFNHIKEWNSTHARPTCISSLRIRDITICEIHYWRRSMQWILVGWVSPMFITMNNMWVWQINHQHAHNCLNSMILPYRQLAMDKFRINKSFMDLNMQKWNTIDMNENDYNHYINSLQI